MAGPVSYEVDGEQYVAVPVGWGGVFALAPGEIGLMSGRLRNKSRVLAFKLGGRAELPVASMPAPLAFDPPPADADDKTVVAGKALFHRHCATCHGDAAISAGLLPDLRASPALEGETLAVDRQRRNPERPRYGLVRRGTRSGRRRRRARLCHRASAREHRARRRRMKAAIPPVAR